MMEIVVIKAGLWADETTGLQFNHMHDHPRKLRNVIEKATNGDDHLDHLITQSLILRGLKNRLPQEPKAD
jgi:hypothetical protein